jgi:hypothetical protein
MTCLQHLKLIIKDECRDLTREQEWLSMANGRADTLSYAFKLINLSKEYLVCSLEGKSVPIQGTIQERRIDFRTSSLFTGRLWTSYRTFGASREIGSIMRSKGCL